MGWVEGLMGLAGLGEIWDGEIKLWGKVWAIEVEIGHVG